MARRKEPFTTPQLIHRPPFAAISYHDAAIYHSSMSQCGFHRRANRGQFYRWRSSGRRMDRFENPAGRRWSSYIRRHNNNTDTAPAARKAKTASESPPVSVCNACDYADQWAMALLYGSISRPRYHVDTLLSSRSIIPRNVDPCFFFFSTRLFLAWLFANRTANATIARGNRRLY